MTAHKKTVPAKNPGGRPRKPPDERTVVVAVRLTPARKAKLRRLGSTWLSRQLDEAPEPFASDQVHANCEK